MDSKQRDRLIDILNLGESNLVKADMIQELLSQLEQEDRADERKKIEEWAKRTEIYDSDDSSMSVIAQNGYNKALKDLIDFLKSKEAEMGGKG